MLIAVNMPDDCCKVILVYLPAQEDISKIRSLLGQRRNSQAIIKTLSCGEVKGEHDPADLANLKADLILSSNSAYWTLT